MSPRDSEAGAEGVRLAGDSREVRLVPFIGCNTVRIFPCLLLLIGVAGCQPSNEPQLTSLTPSVVEQGQLPNQVTLFGIHLHNGVQLAVDGNDPATLSTPRVQFGDQLGQVVALVGVTELHVALPLDLQPGSYDVVVSWGSQRHATLAPGLLVLGLGVTTASGDVTTLESTTGSTEAAVTSGTVGNSIASDDSGPAASDAGGPVATPDAGVNPSASIGTSGDVGVDAQAPSGTSSGVASVDATASSGEQASSEVSSSDVSSSDVSSAEPSFRCAAGAFGAPELVTLQGYSGTRLWSPTLTADGKTLYFADSSTGTERLMKATRTGTEATFTGVTALPLLFASGSIGTPYVSLSGLSLYFYSTQADGAGSRDLYVAKRATTSDDFGSPQSLTALNSAELDYLPWVSEDELTLWYVSHRDGESGFWSATRSSTDDEFASLTKHDSLSMTSGNNRVFISSDGLRLYFSQERTGGLGLEDIWFATRETVSDEFSNVTSLAVVNTTQSDREPTLSPDGEEMFFVRQGTPSNSMYRAFASCD